MLYLIKHVHTYKKEIKDFIRKFETKSFDKETDWNFTAGPVTISIMNACTYSCYATDIFCNADNHWKVNNKLCMILITEEWSRDWHVETIRTERLLTILHGVFFFTSPSFHSKNTYLKPSYYPYVGPMLIDHWSVGWRLGLA